MILDVAFLASLIAAGIRMATPIIFAAFGEALAERSGVINIGIEGMMIMGALFAFLTTYVTGNPWLGLTIGLIVGGLMALIHAVLSITLKVNQIVSGLALTILGSSLSFTIFKIIIGTAPTTPPKVEIWGSTPIPGMSQIPIIGQALFQQHFLTYLAFFLVFILAIFLFRTTWGLAIRSVGENPAAADSVGTKVQRVRYLCTIFGGIMAGAGGAFLVLVQFNMFFPGMTAGRGWIALAVVILGRWNPYWIFAGGLLFGLLDSLQMRLQAIGVPIPYEFLLMTPYIATIIVMMIAARKKVTPAALGVPFTRGGER